MRVRRHVLAAIVIALAAAGCTSSSQQSSDTGLGYRAVSAGPAVALAGKPMATFPHLTSAPAVRVINLWAVWCGPCQQEAPILAAAHAQLAPQGVQFVSVNANDNEPKAARFAVRHHWNWPQYYDKTGKMLLARHFDGMPNTLILNKAGHLTGYFVGPIPNVAALVRAVHTAATTSA